MRLSSFQKLILFLTVLLGILIAIQYRITNAGFKYMSIKEMYANSIELEVQRAEVEQLHSKIEALETQIQTYQTANDSERINFEKVLSDELENAQLISGLTDVEGPGVVIIVDDGTRELNFNESPDNIMVHDLDIRAMVDDLRNAGAEAISINGQRVIFNKSNIQCTGPTIKINDQIYAPPYIITAIGDRRFLESAINAPGSYSENLRNWGVYVEVNTSISITIPAFSGEVNYRYLY
ncbi:DUF881 domain-containing protein [Fusibacter paucivorans]|uniref:DUF881 domain-containing protein n=1 Tax=Fusibacter paucivorans TaxID=76009 RepID=A0ABS5PRQ5_9FIRM|nr:DUF881 domain-containing protein [Fusibacter paucivorans]MBS7527542.1 DUF881 domain-containing protein [Fusibacter paucivorans]